MRTIGQKRIYETPTTEDGVRILIDRLWPRGVSKERARIDYWAREIAPSDDLRKWYRHDHEKWPLFRERYFAELEANAEAIERVLEHMGQHTTLVFSSREEELNNAAALIEYLCARIDDLSAP